MTGKPTLGLIILLLTAIPMVLMVGLLSGVALRAGNEWLFAILMALGIVLVWAGLLVYSGIDLGRRLFLLPVAAGLMQLAGSLFLMHVVFQGGSLFAEGTLAAPKHFFGMLSPWLIILPAVLVALYWRSGPVASYVAHRQQQNLTTNRLVAFTDRLDKSLTRGIPRLPKLAGKLTLLALMSPSVFFIYLYVFGIKSAAFTNVSTNVYAIPWYFWLPFFTTAYLLVTVILGALVVSPANDTSRFRFFLEQRTRFWRFSIFFMGMFSLLPWLRGMELNGFGFLYFWPTVAAAMFELLWLARDISITLRQPSPRQ